MAQRLHPGLPDRVRGAVEVHYLVLVEQVVADEFEFSPLIQEESRNGRLQECHVLTRTEDILVVHLIGEV